MNPHLRELKSHVLKGSSPYRPGIMATINELHHALLKHDRFVETQARTERIKQREAAK